MTTFLNPLDKILQNNLLADFFAPSHDWFVHSFITIPGVLFAMSSPHTPHPGEYHDLRVVGSFKIGRSPLCNIILKNGHVSKVHCSLNISSKDDHGLRLAYQLVFKTLFYVIAQARHWRQNGGYETSYFDSLPPLCGYKVFTKISLPKGKIVTSCTCYQNVPGYCKRQIKY